MTDQKITEKEKQFLISVLNRYKAEEAKVLADFDQTMKQADKDMNAALEAGNVAEDKVNIDELEKKLQDL